MSEDQPTQTGDLGAMPDPEAEPGEPNPGGVDALPDDDESIPADLGLDANPAVEESPDPLKEVLSEGEDTQTEATRSEGGGDSGDSGNPGDPGDPGDSGTKESPA